MLFNRIHHFRQIFKVLLQHTIGQIDDYISGDHDVRISCDEEGELYLLFHKINSLAAILNAHAENERRSKIFMKETISDISHQLKTPLAALNIYNGILQEETEKMPVLKEFTSFQPNPLCILRKTTAIEAFKDMRQIFRTVNQDQAKVLY